jgi:hypothetical protein
MALEIIETQSEPDLSKIQWLRDFHSEEYSSSIHMGERDIFQD